MLALMARAALLRVPHRAAVALLLLLVVKVSAIFDHFSHDLGVHVVVLHYSDRLLHILEIPQGDALRNSLGTRDDRDPVLDLLEGVLDKLVEELGALVLVTLLCKRLLDLFESLEADGGAAHRTARLRLFARLDQPLLHAREAEGVAAAGRQGRSVAEADGAVHGADGVGGLSSPGRRGSWKLTLFIQCPLQQ